MSSVGQRIRVPEEAEADYPSKTLPLNSHSNWKPVIVLR
jgi:hypothetical protein